MPTEVGYDDVSIENQKPIQDGIKDVNYAQFLKSLPH
jgi:hypothetical protein